MDNNPASFNDVTRSVNAVLGGVMVGWGVFMLAVVSGPFRRHDLGLVNPMILALLAWFVVDSAGSLVSGLPENVVLNVLFLAIFLVPLNALRLSANGRESSATPSP